MDGMVGAEVLGDSLRRGMKRAEFALMSKSVVHYNAVPGTNTCPRSACPGGVCHQIHHSSILGGTG